MSTNEMINNFYTTIRNEKNASSNTGFILSQGSSYWNQWNPYSVVISSKSGSKSYKLNNILFYDANGVKAQTGSGWFGINNYLEGVVFVTSKEIRVKRNSKDEFDFSKMNYPFVVKDIAHNWDNNYYLYIPISDLPKFDISYKKEGKMIRKYADIGLPNPVQNYIGETVKYLNCSMNDRIELNEMLEQMAKESIYQKSDEEFEASILKLRTLREKMKSDMEAEKDYTVEDYLKEING